MFELRDEFNEFIKMIFFVVPGEITCMNEKVSLIALFH